MNIIYLLVVALILSGIVGFTALLAVPTMFKFIVQLTFFGVLSLLVIAVVRDDNTGGQ